MPLPPARFLPASQVPDMWAFNGLVYGASGTGKTTLGATLADVCPTLLIDFDGGARSIAHRADVTVFQPLAWSEIAELLPLIVAGQWGAVVLDSLSSAYRLCMAATLAKAGRSMAVMEQGGKTNDYAEVNERVLKMIDVFARLAHSHHIHILFTAWEARKEQTRNEKTLIDIGPELSARISIGARHMVDSVARLSYTRGQRVLTLRSDSNAVSTKQRIPPTVQLPAELTNPTFPQLLTLLKGDTP